MKRSFSRILVATAIGGLMASTAFAGEVDKKTERLWKAKCGSCHGVDGKGDTSKGKELKVPNLTLADTQKKDDAGLKKTFIEGAKEHDKYDDLKPEQVEGLIALIRSLK